MARISVLDQSVAELIAAGEVIERPASIVKEVLENSIDAGADHIIVEIRNGGRTFIRITDNGCGIAGDDMPVAFLRHATSKLHTESDLQEIATLGFRGEALASICAVSEVEMTSKIKAEEFGNILRLKAGDQVLFEQTGCPDGTTLIIRNLFYNVPARLKFLKKDAAETAAVTSVVEKIMLSHPEVSFRYVTDGSVRISGGGGSLSDSAYAVFGREFASGLIPIDYAFNGITVKGLITRPDAGRATRGMQHFYVNNRFVKSKTCAAALEDAYKGTVMVGKFPGCIVNVDMNLSMVDVNVHPAKIEIRFSDEKAVYDAMYFAVKNTLLGHDALQNQMNHPVSLAPAVKEIVGTQVEFDGETPVVSQTKDMPRGKDPSAAERYHSVFGNFTEELKDVTPAPTALPDINMPLPNPEEWEIARPEQRNVILPPSGEPSLSMEAETEHLPVSEQEEPFESEERYFCVPEQEQDFKFVGELFATYVILECGENVLLFDKHAAHEKMIYDRLKAQVKFGESQLLMVPYAVSVNASEFDMIFTEREALEKMGFSFDDFGSHTLLIRAVPPILSELADPFAPLLEAAQKISMGGVNPTPEEIDELLHSMACKAAIKAHDVSQTMELIHLAQKLLADDTVRHCPHGRPIIQVFSKAELDRRFGRIV